MSFPLSSTGTRHARQRECLVVLDFIRRRADDTAFNASDPHSVKQPEILLCPRLFVPVSSSATPPDTQPVRPLLSSPLSSVTRSLGEISSRVRGWRCEKIVISQPKMPHDRTSDETRDTNANMISSDAESFPFCARGTQSTLMECGQTAELEFIARRNSHLSKSRPIARHSALSCAIYLTSQKLW